MAARQGGHEGYEVNGFWKRSNEGNEVNEKQATDYAEYTEGARVAAGPRFARLDHVPQAWPQARPRRLKARPSFVFDAFVASF